MLLAVMYRLRYCWYSAAARARPGRAPSPTAPSSPGPGTPALSTPARAPGALRDDGARGEHRARLDARALEHDRAHADQRLVLDHAALEQRAVADGDVGADDGGQLVRAVDDRRCPGSRTRRRSRCARSRRAARRRTRCWRGHRRGRRRRAPRSAPGTRPRRSSARFRRARSAWPSAIGLTSSIERLYDAERKSSVTRGTAHRVATLKSSRRSARSRCRSTCAPASSSRACSTCRRSTSRACGGSSPSRPTPSSSARPSYLRAAQHAPALNNFGSAMSIIQDELAHAHIGYRLLGDLGVDMDWLIYERPAEQFKYPYAFDVPLNSWVELVCANALYDQAGFVLLSATCTSRARSGPGSARWPRSTRRRRSICATGARGCASSRVTPTGRARGPGARSTGCSSSRSSGSACPTTASSTPSSSTTASRASPTISCARRG